jgi:hypothetical protein
MPVEGKQSQYDEYQRIFPHGNSKLTGTDSSLSMLPLSNSLKEIYRYHDFSRIHSTPPVFRVGKISLLVILEFASVRL